MWSAVSIARNVENGELPNTMYLNGMEIADEDLSDAFANHFEMKFRNIVK